MIRLTAILAVALAAIPVPSTYPPAPVPHFVPVPRFPPASQVVPGVPLCGLKDAGGFKVPVEGEVSKGQGTHRTIPDKANLPQRSTGHWETREVRCGPAGVERANGRFVKMVQVWTEKEPGPRQQGSARTGPPAAGNNARVATPGSSNRGSGTCPPGHM
jgi:hypothetical protein